MSRKTVALDLQPCCGKRSGVGNVAYELARRLHDADEIRFQGNVFNFMGRNDNGPSLDGITYSVKECRLMPYGAYRRMWDYVPIKYSTLFGKADLSVFFNFVIPKTLKGKSLVYIHDFTYIRYPETMSKTNYQFISENTSYSASRADRILVNSEFTKQELCELMDVTEDKVDVIYPSVSLSGKSIDVQGQVKPLEACTSWEKPALAALFEKHGIAFGTPYLLFVSTIEPRKNLVRLLQAFELLKTVDGIPHKLILAGGSGWNNEEIYSAAADLKAKDDVIFTGFVTSDEKNALYRYADAFVFPSIYEGFGIPPIEAMSFGCPVVAARAGSLPEVCGEAAEMVDPLDVKSIEEGIRRVIYNNAYRKKMIQSGYMQEKIFSWDDSAEKLFRIIQENV